MFYIMAIKNLPIFAQAHFNRECAKFGAVCHPAGEDETGWDFLIEIDEYNNIEYTEEEILLSYIQVKSATAGKLKCKIKLSNALRSCRSSDPWFIFLVSEKDGEEKTYIKYFDKKIMERSLKRIWQANVESRALNREFLYITFSEEDETNEDLILMIRKSIGKSIKSYRDQKSFWFETLGREESAGVGNFSITADPEDILKEFLGLGDGLKVNSFEFFDQRFGIKKNSPVTDAESGIIKISPNPVAECKLRLIYFDTNETIEIAAQVYNTGIPTPDKSQTPIRISADFIEIVRYCDNRSSFSLNFNYDELKDLSSLSNFSKLMVWFKKGGKINSEIWHHSIRILNGEIDATPHKEEVKWELIYQLITFIGNLFNSTDEYVNLEMSKIFKFHDELYFAEAFTSNNMINIDIENIHGDWKIINRAIYFIFIEIGSYQINILVERDCKIEEKDGKLWVSMNNPKLLEHSLNSGSNYDQLSKKYDAIIDEIGKDYVLELGDALDLAKRSGEN